MSKLPDVPNMLAEAERSASAGDFTSADALLKDVARIQEAELGPLHPDLANTLNNLAVVAEKSERPDDAEAFYRRAVAIASASLPADDPMAAASRQNLEDFCLARGVPIDRPTVVKPSEWGIVLEPQALPGVEASSEAQAPVPAAPSAEPTTSQSFATASPTPSRWPAMVAAGVLILVAVVLYVRRPWSSSETSTPNPTAAPAAPRADKRARSQPAVPAPIEPAQPRKAAEEGDRRGTEKRAAPQRSSDVMTLATVQLCRTFSTGAGNWQCDPVGDSVAPGSIVLYTRVRSARDAAVVHRWFRGDTLRQSVQLRIRASATEGYRTYSRQTVDSGDWRVEVRTVGGELLHEQRFVAR